MTTWRMEHKYIVRRRVAFVIAIALAVLLLVGTYQLVSQIWWVGDHYCFGDLTECFPEFGGK